MQKGKHVRGQVSPSSNRCRSYQVNAARSRAGGYTSPAAPRPAANQLYPDYVKKRKRNRLFKRVGIGVLAVVFAAVCVVGGYAAWYSSALDNALSMGAEQDASVDAALASGEMGRPFYMLLLGSDSREGNATSNNPANQGDNERSDVMILARVDADNKKVTLVSIPRDTPYTLDDGTVVKINEVYNREGAAGSIKAVSKVTGAPITHYAEVHFSEFQEIVDKLGGVTVDVPIEVSYKDALTGDKITIEPGVQTLNGQQAQIFARARHEYGENQEAKRQSNIRTVLMAIVQKVLEKPLTDLPGTVLDLANSVGTDMNTVDIVSLALAFSGGGGHMAMYSCTGPSNGDFMEQHDGIWLCYENPEGWAKLMEVVDAGEDPSELDVESTAVIPQALGEAA